jgi:hypothetical protein
LPKVSQQLAPFGAHDQCPDRAASQRDSHRYNSESPSRVHLEPKRSCDQQDSDLGRPSLPAVCARRSNSGLQQTPTSLALGRRS